MMVSHSSQLDRQKASAEMMQQEMATITTGLTLEHKKKISPLVRDNGDITAWETKSTTQMPVAYKREQSHHDVLKWF
jgi:hypothetical protein